MTFAVGVDARAAPLLLVCGSVEYAVSFVRAGGVAASTNEMNFVARAAKAYSPAAAKKRPSFFIGFGGEAAKTNEKPSSSFAAAGERAALTA